MAHIGIDARLTYYRVGGISTYIKRTLSALEQLNTDDTYTVFTSRKAKDPITQKFQTAKLWTPAHHCLERLAMSVELARFRLDLLHSPDFIPPLRGAKHHIITVHDLTFLHYPQYITAESRRYYNDQIDVAVRQADHILSDSESTKTDLINLLNVPAEKITVHMLGVDEQFRPLPVDYSKPIIDMLDLPQRYFLCLGTLEPRKNLVGLCEAYRELLAELPDAPILVLVGRQGWHYEQLKQDIDAVGLGDKLRILHNVSDKQLPALYNHAVALITPSFYEGFGLPALEAMACGIVPIVSNLSSLPEITGDVGLLIDPHQIETITQAMKKVLTDPEWCIQESKRAIERAKQFTWENTARIVHKTYQDVLAK